MIFGSSETPASLKGAGVFDVWTDMHYSVSRRARHDTAVRAGGGIRTHDLTITNRLRYPCATPADKEQGYSVVSRVLG